MAGGAFRFDAAQLRAIIANLNAIVRVIACDGMYRFSEGRGLATIGRQPDDLVGQSIFDIQRDRPDILADVRRALAGEELATIHDMKGVVWESRYSPLYNAGVLVGTVYVAMDVTARVRAEEAVRESEARLAYQATHDVLTGLPNRAHFLDQLTQALARGGRATAQVGQGGQTGRVAVLFLDLDGFKEINDRFGHAAGDAVLVAVADRLWACVRPEDMVARLGGDEFTLLIEDVRAAETAVGIAERLVVTLATPIPLDGEEQVCVTASIGIALGGDPHMRAEDVLHAADTAMYRAKRGGASRYWIGALPDHLQVVHPDVADG